MLNKFNENNYSYIFFYLYYFFTDITIYNLILCKYITIFDKNLRLLGGWGVRGKICLKGEGELMRELLNRIEGG